jgi:hypothetical protein
MYANPETEARFQRWASHVRNTVGYASDKILRYFWDLYDFLLSEIKTTSKN